VNAVAPREFYDATYHFDEDVGRPNYARLWRSLRQLEPLAGKTFLDLGCGVGSATQLALARGHVRLGIGLDFSRRALELAKQHVPAGVWVHGDGIALPFADGSIDRIFAFGSMEHFPNIRRGFDEVRRVLAPGGHAAVVVPNFYVHTDQPLEFRATYAGWKRVIDESGLRVVTVATDAGPAVFKNRRPLRILLRVALRVLSLIPALRYQFVFVVRRM
jgi:SAM-dependent methyltransferase